jgi:hypothetical protein
MIVAIDAFALSSLELGPGAVGRAIRFTQKLKLLEELIERHAMSHVGH